MSTTMATGLPVLSRPAMEPPTSALPPIPLTKPPRKSLPVLAESSKTVGDMQSPSKLRTPSIARPSALLSHQQSASTPTVPTLSSSSSIDKPTPLLSEEKIIRRIVSIASFPQPPAAGSRPATASSMCSVASSKRRTSDINGTITPGGSVRSKRPSRISNANSLVSYRGSQTPSLLNGAGDGKSIPLVDSHRTSDGQFSNTSPAHSRSSSAEGSYSTSATTFEDTEEVGRGRSREATDDATDSKRNSKGKEIKGNVIVSVRVRPDAAGQDASKAEGEWMVDGRRSLVAYRGREGGDYYYGEFPGG